MIKYATLEQEFKKWTLFKSNIAIGEALFSGPWGWEGDGHKKSIERAVSSFKAGNKIQVGKRGQYLPEHGSNIYTNNLAIFSANINKKENEGSLRTLKEELEKILIADKSSNPDEQQFFRKTWETHLGDRPSSYQEQKQTISRCYITHGSNIRFIYDVFLLCIRWSNQQAHYNNYMRKHEKCKPPNPPDDIDPVEKETSSDGNIINHEEEAAPMVKQEYETREIPTRKDEQMFWDEWYKEEVGEYIIYSPGCDWLTEFDAPILPILKAHSNGETNGKKKTSFTIYVNKSKNKKNKMIETIRNAGATVVEILDELFIGNIRYSKWDDDGNIKTVISYYEENKGSGTSRTIKYFHISHKLTYSHDNLLEGYMKCIERLNEKKEE
jgi:hypothetical protein